MRRKLIKVASFDRLLADGYAVEGSDAYVLELVMHGFAQASCYVLLKSRAVLQRADDAAVAGDIGAHPSKYGRVLRFDRELFRDGGDGSVSIELP